MMPLIVVGTLENDPCPRGEKGWKKAKSTSPPMAANQTRQQFWQHGERGGKFPPPGVC
jgi:hypothetical protein